MPRYGTRRQKRKALTPEQTLALANYEPHLSAETRRQLVEETKPEDLFPQYKAVLGINNPKLDYYLEFTLWAQNEYEAGEVVATSFPYLNWSLIELIYL